MTYRFFDRHRKIDLIAYSIKFISERWLFCCFCWQEERLIIFGMARAVEIGLSRMWEWACRQNCGETSSWNRKSRHSKGRRNQMNPLRYQPPCYQWRIFYTRYPIYLSYWPCCILIWVSLGSTPRGFGKIPRTSRSLGSQFSKSLWLARAHFFMEFLIKFLLVC